MEGLGGWSLVMLELYPGHGRNFITTRGLSLSFRDTTCDY